MCWIWLTRTLCFFFLQSSLITWAADYTELIHLIVIEHLLCVGHFGLMEHNRRRRQTWWPCPHEDHSLVGVRQRSKQNNYISRHRSKIEETARKLWVNHRAVSSTPRAAAQKWSIMKVQQWRLASVSAFIIIKTPWDNSDAASMEKMYHHQTLRKSSDAESMNKIMFSMKMKELL